VQRVRVIREEEQLGILEIDEALRVALEANLDLVEVAPTADPPVCRIMDYGRFKYEQSKRERESRRSSKHVELREVRMKVKIGQHDVDFKARTASKLLDEGDKVKVSVMFRGREREHPEVAMNLLREVAETLKEESKLEQAPNLEGRMMSIVLAPAKALVGAETKEAPESGEDAETKNA